MFGQNISSKRKSAFTLVELIIVITILAILATIGFISYQSYTSDARDANRTTSIKSAQDGLEIYSIKSSTYPSPDSPTTLTGGNTIIIQGTLGTTVSNAIKLMGGIKDPKTSSYYVYSTSGNGKYYQIRADLENSVSYNSFVNTTYASATKALVKGNYSFDPSLPSLITVTGSVNTASGIFDPNVCFVIDGGNNLVTSNSATCSKKKDISFKNFDSNLVGYWDMESLNGTKLKDLSGNGNDGTIYRATRDTLNGYNNFAGTYTGGILGKAMQFDITGTSRFSTGTVVNLGTGNSLNLGNIATFSMIIKTDGLGTYNWASIIGKGNGNGGDIVNYGVGIGYVGHINNRIAGKINMKLNGIPGVTGAGCGYVQDDNVFNLNEVSDNKFKFVTFVYNGDNGGLYINGIKIVNCIFDNNRAILSHTPIIPTTIGGVYTSPSATAYTKDSYQFMYNGIIDDVKIYNRALLDSEIAQQARIAGF
ncbi:MAG: prepilin-type N-terminal cleavage/methylation domain-containing protein [Candidatus Gracilibacteria bacterium]|nr:prepilin-type N-terminal cleavage/methylation domain-containing protein [Candidatus Gracilibacteria bacterium]